MNARAVIDYLWGIKFVKNWRTSRLSLNVRELYALLQQDQ